MKEYKTINEISGPLVFAEVDEPVGYDEIVEIETPSGETKRGQVLETSDGLVSIQVFEGTKRTDALRSMPSVPSNTWIATSPSLVSSTCPRLVSPSGVSISTISS